MNPSLETGLLLGGRYRLDALLARGGMAEVWEATDLTLVRSVAVKVLHPQLADDHAFRRRFRAEAVASARLVHPNIVAIYDTCDEEGANAIVMELVHGRTLREYLDERGHLEPVEVVHIGAQVASGLDCAHRHDVIHRDIKPANILLSDDGRVLVTDFGIAKMLDAADVTRTSTLLGTVKYLAPEQIEGDPVDGRTDVYGLGSVLYEALCGHPPFERDSSSATALARLTADPQPASSRSPGVSSALDPVLACALARVPAERYSSALDLRAALLAVPTGHPDIDATVTSTFADRPTPASGSTPDVSTPAHRMINTGTRRPPTPRRRPIAVIGVALLIISALVVIALLIATTDLGQDLRSTPAETPMQTNVPAKTVAISTNPSAVPRGGNSRVEHRAGAGDILGGQARTPWTSAMHHNHPSGNPDAGPDVTGEG